MQLRALIMASATLGAYFLAKTLSIRYIGHSGTLAAILSGRRGDRSPVEVCFTRLQISIN
jgi:hypothetical protein